MRTVVVYGYFTLKDFEIKGKKVAAESMIYCGIDTTDKLWRWQEHTKPAKKHVQEINTWLQDHEENEDWVYVELFRLDCYVADDAKPAIHLLEGLYVDKYKPILNVYKK